MSMADESRPLCLSLSPVSRKRASPVSDPPVVGNTPHCFARHSRLAKRGNALHLHTDRSRVERRRVRGFRVLNMDHALPVRPPRPSLRSQP